MKIVIVGATGTIGKEVVKAFETDNEVIKVGKNSGDFQVDIASSKSIEILFEKIGNFDTLICTAGNSFYGPLEKMTDLDFRTGVESKLMGQVNLVLIGQKYINYNGSFTLTSGILYEEPILNASNFSAINGAINSFVIASAIELKNNVRINVVCPSVIENSPEKIKLYPGYEPVKMPLLVNAYKKSVLGILSGKVFKVY